jgi:hypothetical protein
MPDRHLAQIVSGGETIEAARRAPFHDSARSPGTDISTIRAGSRITQKHSAYPRVSHHAVSDMAARHRRRRAILTPSFVNR